LVASFSIDPSLNFRVNHLIHSNTQGDIPSRNNPRGRRYLFAPGVARRLY